MNVNICIILSLLLVGCAAPKPKQAKQAKKPAEQTVSLEDTDLGRESPGQDFDRDDDDRNDRDDDAGSTATDDTEGECYKADQFICDVERHIWRQTNELRESRSPLEFSPKISFVARLWSESQSDSGFISHLGFPFSRESDYQKEFGSSGSLNAENVAYTYSGAQTAEEVAREFTEMWWGSSGHRANMLGNHFALGVGVFKEGRTYYATQIFGRD